MQRRLLFVALAIVGAATTARAHHSFAVFFDDKTAEISGPVTEFRFTNPHGLIALTVTDAKGQTATWRVETNAQTLMRRRGWTADTIKIGEVITVEGWLARDGTQYMRMRRIARADGTVLFGPQVSQPADGGRP